MDELLQSHQLLVILGQGGVGKTTVSAALGIRAAYLGLRTAVITIDPANRLADAFAIEGPMQEQTQIQLPECMGTLHAMMLDRQQTCDMLVRRFSSDMNAQDKILNNPYYKHFSTSLAGGQEYMAIETVCQLLTSDEYDLVILDTPPSVHAFDFLDAPKRLINGIRRLPSIDRVKPDSFLNRLKEKSGALVLDGLRRFTGGRFLTDLTEFLGLFKNVLSALSDSSEQLEGTLRDPSTAFLYVDIKDHGVKTRIATCTEALKRRKLKLQGVLYNRTRPTISIAKLSSVSQHLKLSLDQMNQSEHFERLERSVRQAIRQITDSEPGKSTHKDPSKQMISQWSIPLKRGWVSNLEALTELGNDISADL